MQINFSQNAGWQGSVQWLEAKKSIFFRSLLELTMLMRQAAEKTASPGSLKDDLRSRLSASSLKGEESGHV